jgi:hypothetical protein
MYNLFKINILKLIKMSNCTTCKCKNQPCGCEDQGLLTPCPPTIPCDDPNACPETFDAKCVYYNGISDDCTGIQSGMTVTEVIQQLEIVLGPFLCLQCPSVFLPISGTIDVSLIPTLTWNAVSGATGYDVYFDTVTPPTTLVLEDTTATSYTIVTPLLENTTYYWQIVSQNAGGEALDCPIEEFTTLTVPPIPIPPCVNPVQYILDIAINGSPSTDYADILATIESTLTNGIILTECDLCCPDCNGQAPQDSDPYVLGNTLNFIDIITYLGEGQTWACCLNVEASLIAYSTFNEAIGDITFNTCCNEFGPCANNISDAVENYSDILTDGIVEYNSLNGDTALCTLLDTLQAIAPSLTPLELQDLIIAILGLGIVVDCQNGKIMISSIPTYITYNPF